MKKELGEKIAREYLWPVFDRGIVAQGLDLNLGTDEFFFNVADQILALIKEAQGVPPLLSDEEIRVVEMNASNEYKKSIDHSMGRFASYNLQKAISSAIAKAQRDEDWRYYETKM